MSINRVTHISFPIAIKIKWHDEGFKLNERQHRDSMESERVTREHTQVFVKDFVSRGFPVNGPVHSMLASYSDMLYLQIIKKFRDDELHHHDTGLEHDAEKVQFHRHTSLFSNVLLNNDILRVW